MKHLVRLLVTVLILGVVGGGVWYFVFRTKPNDVVFKETTQVLNKIDDIEISYIGTYENSGSKVTFTGLDKIIEAYKSRGTTVYVSEETEPQPLNNTESKYYNYLFKSYGTSDIGLYDYDKVSYSALEYYYALSSNAEDVKLADRKNLVKLIENFESKIDSLAVATKDVLEYRNKFLYGNTTGLDVYINTFTTSFYNKYVSKMIAQNELFFGLRDYVNKYVFDKVVPDHKSAIYYTFVTQFNLLLNQPEKINNVENDLRIDYFEATQAAYQNYVSYNPNAFINTNSTDFIVAFENLSSTDINNILKLNNDKKEIIMHTSFDTEDYFTSATFNSAKTKLASTDVILSNATFFTEAEKTEFNSMIDYLDGKDITDGFVHNDTDSYLVITLKKLVSGEEVTGITEVTARTMLNFVLDTVNTFDGKLTQLSTDVSLAKTLLEYAHDIINYAQYPFVV